MTTVPGPVTSGPRWHKPSRRSEIVAMFISGMTPRAIAKHFDISTQAVYTHLSRARAVVEVPPRTRSTG